MLKYVRAFLKFCVSFLLTNFFHNVERCPTLFIFVLLWLYPRTSLLASIASEDLAPHFPIELFHMDVHFYFFLGEQKQTQSIGVMQCIQNLEGDHWHWTTLAGTGSNGKAIYMYLEAYAHALRSTNNFLFLSFDHHILRKMATGPAQLEYFEHRELNKLNINLFQFSLKA